MVDFQKSSCNFLPEPTRTEERQYKRARWVELATHTLL
jgi:hypothetical protein